MGGCERTRIENHKFFSKNISEYLELRKPYLRQFPFFLTSLKKKWNSAIKNQSNKAKPRPKLIDWYDRNKSSSFKKRWIKVYLTKKTCSNVYTEKYLKSTPICIYQKWTFPEHPNDCFLTMTKWFDMIIVKFCAANGAEELARSSNLKHNFSKTRHKNT